MTRHVVVGAGPAGLSAALELATAGQTVLVLEADPRQVGGLARTTAFLGHRFDVGPHRFYTKSKEIERRWHELLPGELVTVQRLTRICFRGRFFRYPLAPFQALLGLGPVFSASAVASAIAARVRPRRPERSFEDWVVNRFGRTLYHAFFKTYTEKVWGTPCHQISRDWASQRIQGLSLLSAVRQAILPKRAGSQVKSLIESFHYPRHGAGRMWEAVCDRVLGVGGRVELGREVVRVEHQDGRATAVVCSDGSRHAAEHFHFTGTLRRLVTALRPAPPPPVLDAAAGLRHRDFLTVNLVVPRGRLFPDQWLYVHDPQVPVARISSFGNFSPAMVAGPDSSALCLEYFVDRDEPLWRSADGELLRRARTDLETLGLLPRATEGVRGFVTRMPDAYPVYDDDYQRHRGTVRDWIAHCLRNVHPAGRKGLHSYNSQDHAMMSGILSARNALFGPTWDVWDINSEAEYAERGPGNQALEARLVPRRLTT